MAITRGEWIVQDRPPPSSSSGIWVEIKHRATIINTNQATIVGVGVALVFGDSEKERNDNAAIVAAAPDMLDALESAYSLLGVQPFGTLARQVSDKMHAAISKAKG